MSFLSTMRSRLATVSPRTPYLPSAVRALYAAPFTTTIRSLSSSQPAGANTSRVKFVALVEPKMVSQDELSLPEIARPGPVSLGAMPKLGPYIGRTVTVQPSRNGLLFALRKLQRIVMNNKIRTHFMGYQRYVKPNRMRKMRVMQKGKLKFQEELKSTFFLLKKYRGRGY
ncbi:hypothetical protein BZA70DRAFT_274565 [Myxozyma melibiosi]|uniref:Uncharacterized protein n=1 Tax=Myxozyma melibiosi TaxID=54550 RepID=A0ABR1FBZ2_9ASCO